MENVWDYPRPPRLEACARRARVAFGGRTIADSTRALRVLETSHPPAIYIPRADIRDGVLVEAAGPASVCEWKGRARYLDVVVEDLRAARAAWTYPDPTPAFAALRDHVAFYPSRMEACHLDDERVTAQDGDFYGGWITADLLGPFKGPPGTLGW